MKAVGAIGRDNSVRVEEGCAPSIAYANDVRCSAYFADARLALRFGTSRFCVPGRFYEIQFQAPAPACSPGDRQF